MDKSRNLFRADGEQEISALFSLDGDSLQKAGFREPDLSHAPEEFMPPDAVNMAQDDPTGASEYLDNHYTNVNRGLVKKWRAAGILATSRNQRPSNTN